MHATKKYVPCWFSAACPIPHLFTGRRPSKKIVEQIDQRRMDQALAGHRKKKKTQLEMASFWSLFWGLIFAHFMTKCTYLLVWQVYNSDILIRILYTLKMRLTLLLPLKFDLFAF